MNQDQEEKLTDIFRAVLGNDDLVLTNDLTADSVEGWDSMNHITLLLQIESEFNIHFSDDEIVNLVNVGMLKDTITQKL